MAPVFQDFVDLCRQARTEVDWPRKVAEHMRALLGRPGLAAMVRDELGTRDAVVFHTDDQLTIYAIRSEGGLRGPPHDHATSAVVGLIEGAEQFKTYRQEGPRCFEVSMFRVEAPNISIMDEDIIHALWNDTDQTSLSLHIYGNGHFFDARRSLWDPETLERQPFDLEQQLRWSRELSVSAAAS